MSFSRWPVFFSALLVCSGMMIVGCGDGGGDDDSDAPPANPAPTNAAPEPFSADQQLLNSSSTVPANGSTLYTEAVSVPGYGVLRGVVVTEDGSSVTAYFQNLGGDMSVRHGETTGPDIDLQVLAQPDAQWRIGIDNPNAVEVAVGYSIVYDADE